MGIRNPAPSSSYASQRCNRRRGTTDDPQSGQFSQSKCTVKYSRLAPYIPSFYNLREQKMHFLFLFLFFIPSLALSLRLAPCQNTTCRFRFLGFAISILHCPIISTCVSSFLRRPYIPASNKLHSKQACTTAPLAQCIGPASLDRRSGVIFVILPLLMSSQAMDTEPYMGFFIQFL